MALLMSKILTMLFVAMIAMIAGCGDRNLQNYDIFKEEMYCNVDPAKLRKEFQCLLCAYGPGDSVPDNLIHPIIARLSMAKPSMVYIGRWEDAPGAVVVISYGSGFGHWGLVVGSEDYAPPRKEKGILFQKWADGVFFYLEK